MEEHTLSRKKKFAFSVVALVCGTVMLVLISEITIRIFDRLEEQDESIGMFRENPHGTGSHRLKPNFSTTAEIEGQKVWIETNAHGLHWYETPYEKPKGVKRVAFVGDSNTFGLWASRFDKSFVGVFNALLPGEEFEAINFGVSGYGFADMELIIKEEVVQYDPDYVILVAYSGNDFQDTFLGVHRSIVNAEGVASPDQTVLSQKVPRRHYPSQQDEKPEKQAFHWRTFLRENLVTYRRLSELKARLLQDEREESLFIERLNENHDVFFWHTFFSKTEYPELGEQTKEVVLETIGRIHHFLQQRDIPLLIASLPYKRQVYVEQTVGEGYDIRFPQAYVEAFAEENNIPYLDLLPPMRRYVREHNRRIHYKNDGHPNDEGYRLIGNLLYEWYMSVVDVRAGTVKDSLARVEVD